MGAKNARAKRRCARKQTFPTKKAAMVMVRSLHRNGKGRVVEPYQCAVCGGWHVGNRFGGRL